MVLGMIYTIGFSLGKLAATEAGHPLKLATRPELGHPLKINVINST
jgi:hypothetical protein